MAWWSRGGCRDYPWSTTKRLRRCIEQPSRLASTRRRPSLTTLASASRLRRRRCPELGNSVCWHQRANAASRARQGNSRWPGSSTLNTANGMPAIGFLMGAPFSVRRRVRVAPDLTAAQAGSSSRGWGMADRWAIYCRVSTRHQAEDGFSLDDQRAKLTDYAQQRGWDWELFEDAGRSGETLDDRPGMLAVLEAAERRAIVGVLVVDESRLARDELVAATIRSMLRDHGVKLASPGRGEFDLDDPSDAFTSSVLGAAHALEQAMRTAKMKAGLRRTAEAGFWPGGPPPFGYRIADDPEGSKHRVLAIDDQQRQLSAAPTTSSSTTASPCTRPRQSSTLRGSSLSGADRGGTRTSASSYASRTSPAPGSTNRATTPSRCRSRPSSPTTSGTGCSRRSRANPGRNARTAATRSPAAAASISGARAAATSTANGTQARKVAPTTSAVETRKSSATSDASSGPASSKPSTSKSWCGTKSWPSSRIPTTCTPSPPKSWTTRPSTTGIGVRGLNRRLDALRDERTAIVREKARSNHLDALDDALAQIDVEEATLKQQLTQAEQRQRLRTQRATVGQQIDAFVDTAQERMASPTVELMAQVFDLLDIDLVRIANHQFEGTGSIPIPEDGGEVWKEGPQRLTPRRSASRRWLRSGPESASSLCRGSLSSAMTCTRRRACSHGACRDTGAIPCPPSCAPKHRAARPCTAIRQGRTMSRIEGTAHNVGGPRA